MKNLIRFLVILLNIFLISTNLIASQKIQILYKIDNTLVTNVDINNELNYLVSLNTELKSLKKYEINEIAKESLIRERIKLNEIKKFFLIEKYENDLLINSILKNLYTRINLNDLDEFKIYLRDFNITIDEVKEKLRVLGPIRYDEASIITLLEKKIHKAEVEVDGKLKLLECAFIVACNSKHTGKGMIIAPKGGFTDKKIDLISVGKDVNRFQVFEVFQKVYKGSHINLPFVRNIKVDSFSIDSGKMSYYNIDGDVVKSQKASVRVIPEAIKLLI